MFDRIKYFILTHKKPLLIGLAIFVVILIVLSFLVGGKKEEAVTLPGEAPTGEEILTGAPQAEEGPLPELTPEQKLENQLKQLALNFTEKFGSYSNQGNFKNIEDLKTLMTEKMTKWAESTIIESKKRAKAGEPYYGITTKAITTSLLGLDEEGGQSSVLVSTQRREAKETMQNERVFYQDMEIGLRKVNEEWKVDSAYWK